MSAAASAAGCCCAVVDVDEEGSWGALEDGSAVRNDGSNSRVFSSVRGTFSSSRFYNCLCVKEPSQRHVEMGTGS